MADPRSRRTGEHNAQIVKLIADAAAMRERIDTLEARVARLEVELSAARKSVKPPPIGAPSAGASGPPRPASKRPGASGPPPLPPMSPVMPPLSKPGGRKSIVDISEIAELVESIPPPPPRSRR